MQSVFWSTCVVNLSGGLSSAVSAERAVERFGVDRTTLVFADTLIEDDDLHRFIDETEEYLGCKVHRIADGRTPFEVFRDVRYLGNTRVDPCSKILKRDLIDRWVSENCPSDVVRVFGYRHDEEDRTQKLASRLPWTCWFPLEERPWLSPAQLWDRVENVWNIRIPNLYVEGFEHNNCGGGCCKAGQKQFRRLYFTHPDRYAYWENGEQDMIEFLGRDDISILRDRRGGTTKPLTLKAFRERIEQDASNYDETDVGAACDCMGVMKH